MKNRKFKTTKDIARVLDRTFTSMSMAQNGVTIQVNEKCNCEDATVSLSFSSSAEKTVLNLVMSVFIDFEEKALGDISDRFICQVEAFKKAPYVAPAY